MGRPLRYSINVMLDGCADHRAAIPNEDTHRHATESLAACDALLLGRVTYQIVHKEELSSGMMVLKYVPSA